MSNSPESKNPSKPAGIPKADLRARHDAALEKARQQASLSPERIAELLDKRARILAREPLRSILEQDHTDIVEFKLGDERYAVEQRFVQEVIALRSYAIVPGAPRFVLGIANVRGRMMSIVDLRRLFDIPEKGITNLNKVIVLHDSGMEYGLLTDSVEGVRSIAETEWLPPPATLTGLRGDFSVAVTKDFLVLLAADKMLRDKTVTMQSAGSSE
ncbi:hypothetical protein BH09SUM1_BH09SUM1_31110 [soil metagenome]